MKVRSLEEQNRLIESELEEGNRLLASWRGARAQIWLFHVTHVTLAICLSRFKEREACYLIGSGCLSIAGPFSWKSADISITRQVLERNVSRYTITDRSAGFELVCRGASVVLGAAFVPINPFRGFSMEDVPPKLSFRLRTI
jgi:hypothetical protein